MKNILFALLTSLLFVSCGGSSSSSSDKLDSFTLNVPPIIKPISSNIPSINSSWNIQLQGTVNESYSVDMYEIDLFDSSEDLINNLKANDIKVICYFNAGAWEDWRQDADDFPNDVLGSTMSGYSNEKWLDITNISLMSIMEARLDLAVLKGCDGVDPDNIDGYTQDSGFSISYNEQLAYNRFIANESRKRGLSVALKNNLDQINDLVDYYDFAVNEECFIYGECDKLELFILKGKAVFNLEYDTKYVNNINSARDDMCNDSNSKNFSTLIMSGSGNLDDSFRASCR